MLLRKSTVGDYTLLFDISKKYPLVAPVEVCQSFQEVLPTLGSVGLHIGPVLGVCLTTGIHHTGNATFPLPIRSTRIFRSPKFPDQARPIKNKIWESL